MKDKLDGQVFLLERRSRQNTPHSPAVQTECGTAGLHTGRVLRGGVSGPETKPGRCPAFHGQTASIYHISLCIMHSQVCCALTFWPKCSGKKVFHFSFQIQVLIYSYLETKPTIIPGCYFACRYHYCFLELHC